ncbi:MAG TPA: ABC transporter ATP-binding protein [Natronincola sp.]|nr:ABC transporter ATP-binding protein [Natronincola sp.]
MHEIIRTVDLTKDYGSLRAVDHLNLSVRQGEILGFLGLNGAGKTTTLRMLLGMISPTAGSCYLQGQKVTPGNIGIWNDVGYLVETAHSYPDLTVRENLELVRKLRDMEDKGSVDWIIEKLKLGDYASVKSKNLSLGNAQRLGIAKALIHKPKILLLDEPTNGLDPAGIIEIRLLLLDLAKNLGVTMIISSHKLEEISRLATNIAIIHHGKLIKSIASKELESHLNKTLLVNGESIRGIKETLSKAGFNVSSQSESGKGAELPLRIVDEEAINNPQNIATILVNSGHPPTLLKIEEEDLEAYFMRIIHEQGGE